MSNMSYCRFQNTSGDLDDCQNALEGLANGDERALSRDELYAAKRLVNTCLDIVTVVAEHIGIDIDELDERKIDQILDELQRNAGD